MITQYFITFIIPLVFSSFVAAIGWFAYEEIGAVVAGITAFVISATWSHFAVITTDVRRSVKSKSDPRRAAAMTRLIAKRA